MDPSVTERSKQIGKKAALCILGLITGLNLFLEKVSDSLGRTFPRNSSFRIPFYCVLSWGCGVDS